jgi:predicted DNA-binding transcriptional regulator YafY
MAKTKSGGSFDRKQRLLDLLPAASRGGITVTALREALAAAGFDVTRRSIERDLVTLEASGHYALQRRKGKPAGWTWRPGHKPPPRLGMDEETALVYVLLERFLTPLVPKSLFGDLVSVFASARSKLASLPGGKLAAWSQRIVVDTSGQPLLLPAVDSRVQKVVSDALLKGYQCEFDYRSPSRADNEPAKRHRVAPLGLVLRDGVQYLICCIDGGHNAYTYALHRMSEPKLLEELRASIPPDFNLADHVLRQRAIDITEGASIRLELRVTEWWSRFLAERRLADDQVISAINGSEDKRVVATIADTAQLRWWLLSLGASVEVVKPAGLRRQMAKEAAAMTRRYQRKGR